MSPKLQLGGKPTYKGGALHPLSPVQRAEVLHVRSKCQCLLYFNSSSNFVLGGSSKSPNCTAKANLFILCFIELCHLRPVMFFKRQTAQVFNEQVKLGTQPQGLNSCLVPESIESHPNSFFWVQEWIVLPVTHGSTHGMAPLPRSVQRGSKADLCCLIFGSDLVFPLPLNLRWLCLGQSDLQFTAGVNQVKEQMSTSLVYLK